MSRVFGFLDAPKFEWMSLRGLREERGKRREVKGSVAF